MVSTTRITGIRRLIAATSTFGNSTHVMEEQTVRTQNRLKRGTDLFGASFAPYKYPEKPHLHSRPLEHAARLFQSPNYDISHFLNETEMRMTIYGRAAQIGNYQNIRRRFVGFARVDREEVKRDLWTTILEVFKRAK
jgi:hypothetical protein